MRFNSLKKCKKYKKIKIIFLFFKSIPQCLDLHISQISKSAWNDGDGETFFIGKCCENEMTQSQHIYRSHQKNQATFSMLSKSRILDLLGLYNNLFRKNLERSNYCTPRHLDLCTLHKNCIKIQTLHKKYKESCQVPFCRQKFNSQTLYLHNFNSIQNIYIQDIM